MTNTQQLMAERFYSPVGEMAPAMDADTYQKLAARTLIDKPDQQPTLDERVTILTVLNMAAEVGILVDAMKKGIFHRHGLDWNTFDRQLSEVEYSIHTIRQRHGDLEWNQIAGQIGGNDQATMLLWNTTGLVGEAGEINSLVLDYCRTGVLEEDKLVTEIGDSSWYLAAILTKIKRTFSEALVGNVKKLAVRYAKGYTSQESINRGDN